MERLTIWSGILILLLHLSCLESRSDLGGHSEVRQNVEGKDNRPFVRHSRGISDFYGSGVGWGSNEDPARTELRHDSEEKVEHPEDEITTPLLQPVGSGLFNVLSVKSLAKMTLQSLYLLSYGFSLVS
ncbi:hypothetical protein BV898_12277 [Hypsibius exemplaris]|uniref:Uncharacterized protein n=1 Tax=Hypsibius exemplaris TaxID=2072580 RepID=A0A1W0WE94_HYPEX|nr:hypothetical protein BV898_12277 [Hypsibius exemplaris]